MVTTSLIAVGGASRLSAIGFGFVVPASKVASRRASKFSFVDPATLNLKGPASMVRRAVCHGYRKAIKPTNGMMMTSQETRPRPCAFASIWSISQHADRL
jgi:hypothetical protein